MSICYLVFSIVDLLLLFLFYEIVHYTLKDFLNVNRVIALAWGIAMIILGVLVIVIEIPLTRRNSENVWKAMSKNEKNFFSDDVGTLSTTRALNSMYIGVFTIAIGACFVGISVTLFKLDRDLKQSIVFPSRSTLPVIEASEQVVFKEMSTVTIVDHDYHHKILKPHVPKKSEPVVEKKLRGETDYERELRQKQQVKEETRAKSSEYGKFF